MSRPASSKPQVVKISLPASAQSSNFHPSLNTVDGKSKKGNFQSPLKPSSKSPERGPNNIQAKIKLIEKTPVSTAGTKGKGSALSPPVNDKQNLINSQISPINGKGILFSRATTVAFEKSPRADGTELARSPKKKAQAEQNQVEVVQEQELSSEEIKERLYRVFQFYTSFAERTTVAYLKCHRFRKMMVDAEVRDEALNQSSLDLLYVGELRNSGNMDFDKFLGLLARVARVKFEPQNDSDALDMLLRKHMFPLYERLFKDNEVNEEVMDLQEPMQTGTRMLFGLVEGTLERIFQMYFSFEIQSGQDAQVLRQRLENALSIFLREFEICPEMISKGAAYALWQEVMKTQVDNIENPNITQIINQSQALNQSSFNQTRETKLKTSRNDRDLPFSFEKFKLFLMRVANFVYHNTANENDIKNNQIDKTALLLEKMDFVYRTLNTDKKTNASSRVKNNTNSSLLVTKQAIEKINEYVKIQEEAEAEAEARSLSPEKGKGKKGDKDAKKASTVVVTTGTKYDIYGMDDDDLIRLYEKNHHSILKVFQYYCSFGEPLNTTRLHAFKFNKLLREGNLLQNSNSYPERSLKILEGLNLTKGSQNEGILPAEADIIVASLTGPKYINEINEKKINYDTEIETPFIGFLNYLYKNNPLNLAVQGRLEFEAFLKALEMVATKIYPDKPAYKAVHKILEKNIFRLEKEINQIQKNIGSQPLKALVDMLQDSVMVEFLSTVHKSLILYYNCYADSKGMMNIERFMQFCKDFGIFPNLVPKGKLCAFFHALAAVRSHAEETEGLQSPIDSTERQRKSKGQAKGKPVDQPEDEFIDQHMFIEAIALCAVEIPYLNPQPSDMQKVFNLLEKLNQSKGPLLIKMKQGVTRNISGSSWDIMHEVRIKYPELFVEVEPETPAEVFESLIQEKSRMK